MVIELSGMQFGLKSTYDFKIERAHSPATSPATIAPVTLRLEAQWK